MDYLDETSEITRKNPSNGKTNNIMGDKNPKAVRKQAEQKSSKADKEHQKKQQMIENKKAGTKNR